MNCKLTDKKFRILWHKKYVNNEQTRLVQESSACGDYEDSYDNPGSSYLWIGQDHHLNRQEVGELIKRLQYWLDNKELKLD